MTEMNTAGLPGRDMISLLLNDAKHKPQIAEYVSRVDEMTVEDIDALPTPLPWYRIALKKLKERNGQNAALTQAAAYAELMGDIEVVEHPRGDTLRYIGPDRDYKPVGRDLRVPVKTGDILFVSSGEVWLGSIPLGPVQTVDLEATVLEQNVIRSAYIYLVSGAVEVGNGERDYNELGFRIQR